MGNKSSKKKLQPAAMDDLLQTTMFTEEEIKSWYKNFLKASLDANISYIWIIPFMGTVHLTCQLLIAEN